MEQLIVIVALIAYFLFRGAARNARRFPGETQDGPVSRGGLEDAIEASQQRALEALQRWEAKQRAAARLPAEPEGEMGGPPIPGTASEAPPRVSITGQRAERQRREAHADIARMLEPAARSVPTPARRSSLRVRAPRESVPTKWAQGAERERHAVESAQVTSARRRGEASAAARPGVSTGVETRGEPLAPPRPRRLGSVKPGAAFGRFERLPLAARAVVYAEILGRPVSLP